MKKILIITISILLSFSCKEITKKDSLLTKKDTLKTKKETLDNTSIDLKNLKLLEELDDICVEDDGVFKNCDELYTAKGANIFLLIIPKIGASNWYEINSKKLKGEIYEINEQLCRMVIDKKNKKNLATDFDIWAFYIDQKFTKRVNLDTPYTPVTPRETLLLKLNSSNEGWELKETFKLKNDSDEVKENEWRNKKIEDLISNSNKKDNKSKISSSWIGKFSTYFDYGDNGGQNTGWELEINITDDKIIARGDGFQMGFLDELSLQENNEIEIYLKHKKNISGYKLGQKMEPEFVIKKVDQKFYIDSKWISNDVKNKKNTHGYLIEKEKN